MDTDNAVICYYKDYSTGAVFYSGKTIYRGEPADKIAGMEPGKISWNAKNVMPFMAIEDVLPQKNNIVIINEKRNNEAVTNYYAAHTLYLNKLSLPGNIDIFSVVARNDDGGEHM